MARILFRLRLVPEEEADEVRQLLEASRIPWFETSAGRWGVSFPALWVRDDDDFPRARQLLEEYQQARTERIRAERGEDFVPETVMSRFLRRPLTTLAVFGFVAIVVYFSIRPFFSILSDR